MKRSNMVCFRPEWQKLDYSRRVSIPESCFKLLLASSFLKSGYEFLKCCDTEQSFCLREKEYCRAVVVSLLLVGGFLWCSVGMVFVCVCCLCCLFVCFSKFQKAETKEDFVKVRRSDLERLTTEVMQLRDFLPKILNGDILWTFQKLDAVESSEWYHVAVSVKTT